MLTFCTTTYIVRSLKWLLTNNDRSDKMVDLPTRQWIVDGGRLKVDGEQLAVDMQLTLHLDCCTTMGLNETSQTNIIDLCMW